MIITANPQKETKEVTIIDAPQMVQIPIDEFRSLQSDVKEIKRLLLNPEDNKFMETALKIGNLENRLEVIGKIEYR